MNVFQTEINWIVENKDLTNIVLGYLDDEIEEYEWKRLFIDRMELPPGMVQTVILPYLRRPSLNPGLGERIMFEVYQRLHHELPEVFPAQKKRHRMTWPFEPTMIRCPDTHDAVETRNYVQFVQSHFGSLKALTSKQMHWIHALNVLVGVLSEDHRHRFDILVGDVASFYDRPSVATFQRYVETLRLTMWTPIPFLAVRLASIVRLFVSPRLLNDSELNALMLGLLTG